MISIVVADDQVLIRTAVRELVAGAADLMVVGEAATGAQAVELVAVHHPDVVLMDIRMPIMNGIDATRLISADPDLAGTRVLVLTTFEEDHYVLQALRAGASGFIGKGTEPDQLLQAIRTVHGGEALLSPLATRALIDRHVAPPAAELDPSAQRAVEQLTQRELEIVLLVARGLSNDEIADRLVIARLTVKTHVNRAMTKLAAHDRAQLVIFAYESGLLRPGAP